MKKVVRLTESDLIRLIQKVLNEQNPQTVAKPKSPTPAPKTVAKPKSPTITNVAHLTKNNISKLSPVVQIAVYDGKTPFYYDLTGISKKQSGCDFIGTTRGSNLPPQNLYWSNTTPLTVSINRKPYKITEKASGLLIKACGTNEYASVGQGGESNYD